MKKIFFLLVSLSIFSKAMLKNIFFIIDDSELLGQYGGVRAYTNGKINIYQPSFYLNDNTRINTNFMIGTIQKVLYLNYPFTFSNNNSNITMKNTNSSGIVILKDQPNNVTTANLSTQNSIIPIAYFTLQENQLGWQLFAPSDFYSLNKIPTKFSFYNDNIYIGKIVGPQERSNNIIPHAQHYHDQSSLVNNYYNNLANFFSMHNTLEPSTKTHDRIEENPLDCKSPQGQFHHATIQDFLRGWGSGNLVLGSHSGTFPDSRYISFNTILGFRSGNYINGACNTFIGGFNGSHNEVDTVILNEDYYAYNNQFNYNNVLGFGNFNSILADTTHATGKLTAIKQNNIVGNFNVSSMRNAFRNVIMGNGILSTIIDNTTAFNWIDSNILIGNKIIFKTNTQPVAGMYGNIMLIPNGDSIINGGLGIDSALGGIDGNYWTICNNAIFLGSCGLPVPYERSNRTFIGNIYNSSLFYSTIVIENAIRIRNTQGLTSLPVVTLVNNADQMGQMELLPYGNYQPDPVYGITCNPSDKIKKSSYYKCQPGNIFNLNNAVSFLLNPESMPIIGIAFNNTESAAKNGLFYTVDVYSMLANETNIVQRNPLAAFIIYNIVQKLPPYTNPNNIDGEAYVIRNSPEIVGYEHYYLIPLIVKALQLLNIQVNGVQDSDINKRKLGESQTREELLSGYDDQRSLKEQILLMYQEHKRLMSLIEKQNEKIELLEEYISMHVLQHNNIR